MSSSFNKTASKSEIFDEKSKNSYENLLMYQSALLTIFDPNTTEIGYQLERFYKDLANFKQHLTMPPPRFGLDPSIKLELEILFEKIYETIKWPNNPLIEKDEHLTETRQQFLRLIRNISIKFNLYLAKITGVCSRIIGISEGNLLYNFFEKNVWYRYSYNDNMLIPKQKNILITNLIEAYQTAKDSSEETLIVDTAEAFDVDIDFIGSLADSLNKSSLLTKSFIDKYFPIILMRILFEIMPTESRRIILKYVDGDILIDSHPKTSELPTSHLLPSASLSTFQPSGSSQTQISSLLPLIADDKKESRAEEGDRDKCKLQYEDKEQGKIIVDKILKFCSDSDGLQINIFNEWVREQKPGIDINMEQIKDLFIKLENYSHQHKRSGVEGFFTLSYSSIRNPKSYQKLQELRKTLKDQYQFDLASYEERLMKIKRK